MSITVLGSFKSALKKYAVFSGRLSRKGYWFFVLAGFLISFAIYFIGNMFLPNSGSEPYSYDNPNLLYSLYTLAVLVPSIAAQIRRLHDINKSGWTFLLGFIPIVGPIILLVFYFKKGDQMENTYGPVPTE